jgi:hypothetical protein
MTDYTVFRPSAKAIRGGVMVEQDRLILLPKVIPTIFPHYGLAMLYQHCDFDVADGRIIGGAVLRGFAPYKAKDSHLCLAREDVPDTLYVSVQDAVIIAEHSIDLPMKNMVIVSTWLD